MIVHELTGGEEHLAYQVLETANLGRQYDFLESMVTASIMLKQPLISHGLLKAFNFHAMACLTLDAGEYRPCPISFSDRFGPAHYLVPPMMDDFINQTNRHWDKHDPVDLAAYVLWRINFIHPFTNGNGKTARAAAYFVMCAKVGEWLAGRAFLPELLRQNRAAYLDALQVAHQSENYGTADLSALKDLITRLMSEQFDRPLGEQPAQRSEPKLAHG